MPVEASQSDKFRSDLISLPSFPFFIMPTYSADTESRLFHHIVTSFEELVVDVITNKNYLLVKSLWSNQNSVEQSTGETMVQSCRRWKRIVSSLYTSRSAMRAVSLRMRLLPIAARICEPRVNLLFRDRRSEKVARRYYLFGKRLPSICSESRRQPSLPCCTKRELSGVLVFMSSITIPPRTATV